MPKIIRIKKSDVSRARHERKTKMENIEYRKMTSKRGNPSTKRVMVTNRGVSHTY